MKQNNICPFLNKSVLVNLKPNIFKYSYSITFNLKSESIVLCVLTVSHRQFGLRLAEQTFHLTLPLRQVRFDLPDDLRRERM